MSTQVAASGSRTADEQAVAEVEVSCREDGCEEPVLSRGWCSLHYLRWWRCGDVHLADRYPIEVFQRRFQELIGKGERISAMCYRGNFIHRCDQPDSDHLYKVLGLREWGDSGKRYRYTATSVSYDMAVRLCDALDLDYFEVGV